MGSERSTDRQTDTDFKGKERTSLNKVPHIFICLGALRIPQLAGSRVLYKYEPSCQGVPFTEHREGSRTPRGNHDDTFSCDSQGPLNRLCPHPVSSVVWHSECRLQPCLTGPGQCP